MGFTIATYNKKKLAEAIGIDEAVLNRAMIASRMGGVMKVWEGEQKDQKGFRFFSARASTSTRKDQNSPWETDWSGFVTFVGGAMDKIMNASIPESGGLSIIVTSAAVKSKYDKANNKTYTNYVVYDFDLFGSESGPSAKTSNKSSSKAAQPAADDDQELPF